MRCRSWGCEFCRPRRHAQLVALAQSGQPGAFITLTSGPETGRSPVEAARALVLAWRKVRREAMRVYGLDRLPFLAVFEATKAGRPHLHILARVRWLDQAWLSKRMAFHARAPIVDIRRVNTPRQVANYVAKYIGKAPHRFGTCKRYWASRDYELPREDGGGRRRRLEGTWSVHFGRLADLLRQYTTAGWAIVPDGDGFMVTEPAWRPP